ncbi:MAG: type II secretion system protein M [Burkholderiaceae bacterium]|jgi:general secretion pathway protein M|nr:type II secretion system protein M [Burkholderiaceae bacterium]HMN63861.1 type II secretion system protein GspM [Burkholderiaceae bacterium]
MLETLLQRWQLMTPRERRIVVAGAALLVAAAVWLLLFEPAWTGRQRLQSELPAMRSQLAQVEQMADEARRLGTVPAGSDSPQAVRAQLEKSIEGAGLKPALAQLTLTGNLFELRFKSVPYAAWLAWLDAAARETRLRVVDAAVTRETGIGVVSVRLALEMPRREAR